MHIGKKNRNCIWLIPFLNVLIIKSKAKSLSFEAVFFGSVASIAAICGQSFAKVNDDYIQPLSLFMIYSGLHGSNKSSAISIQKTSFSEMEIFCRIVTEPTTSAFSENQMVSSEKYTPTSSSSSVEHDTVSMKMSRSAINSSKIFLNLILIYLIQFTKIGYGLTINAFEYRYLVVTPENLYSFLKRDKFMHIFNAFVLKITVN